MHLIGRGERPGCGSHESDRRAAGPGAAGASQVPHGRCSRLRAERVLPTRGDVGPFLIRRIWDGDSEPAGYERSDPNPAMIANEEQERAFHRLSEKFTFGEACRALGKTTESVNCLLHKLVRLGRASKVGRRKYRKGALCSTPEGVAA